MVKKKNKVIEKANEELEYLTGDEAIKRKAELRDKWIRDYKGSIEYAKQEGLRQGIKQNKIEVIKEMLKQEISKEIISKIIKAEIEEIEKIQNTQVS